MLFFIKWLFLIKAQFLQCVHNWGYPGPLGAYAPAHPPEHTHAYAHVRKFPAVDPSGSFLLSELFGEPSFEVARRVASPVEGAGRPEPVLMFELERGCGAAGCFELDLDVPASVYEPDVGSARPIREAAGLPAFEVESVVSEEELTDCVFDFCFRGHNFSPP